VSAGYDPDSIVAALDAGDFSLLTHSGLVSVQLQPPGADTVKSPGDAKVVPVPTNGRARTYTLRRSRRLWDITTASGTGQAVIRAFRPGVEVRAAADGGMPTLHGHFAVFNRFTEIDSWMEGHFLERIAPGAFKKTFREQTPKVLFQHGQDPQIGDKPLGTVESLAEDDTGAAYEVLMLDTAYNRDLIPGLEAGLYGASFRFQVMRRRSTRSRRRRTRTRPAAGADDPGGEVMEFGPVTFPAYADATAGVRSLTDRFLFDTIERDPARARELLNLATRTDAATRSTSGDKPDAATARTSDEPIVKTWPQVPQEEWELLWIPRI
jgi:HK97 family phage prohead protease